MSTPSKWQRAQVHWHEGQFLLPQHFQIMERSLRRQLLAERSLLWPYPHGVIRLELVKDALENRLVQFERLHAIMPSGLEVCQGENTEIPPLKFEDEFKKLGPSALNVALAVPRWSSSGA